MIDPPSTRSDFARVQQEPNAQEQIEDRLQPSIQPSTQPLSHALEGLASHHAQIDVASTLMAVVQKLPLETLSGIFRFCLLQDANAPLHLSRVCRKWREAATCP